MSRPVPVLAVMRPIIIGVTRRPELVTLTPSTPWKSSETKMIVPNIPKAVMKPTIMETAKARLRKRLKGTTGCSARRSSK